MPPAIATHELTKRFDAVTAVNALSLDVQAGLDPISIAAVAAVVVMGSAAFATSHS